MRLHYHRGQVRGRSARLPRRFVYHCSFREHSYLEEARRGSRGSSKVSTDALSKNSADRTSEAIGNSREGALESIEEDQVLATVHNSIDEFTQEEWDACVTALPETNPFLTWPFLSSLEKSNSASPATGWLPQHLALRDAAGVLVAAVPLYLKSHSYGEYVFDHSWANLHSQLGRKYYPKLQSCVPFTPVTGARVLLAPGVPEQEAETMRKMVFQVLQQVATSTQVSSLHMTFNTEAEWAASAQEGWLRRRGLQFHWDNNGYSTFDDFLAALKQSKRKSIRQERKSMAKQGLVIKRLRGAQIADSDWDAFYEFYQDTVDRKWGSAYLTRDFFRHLATSMADSVLLVTAYHPSSHGDAPVAAALNLIGSHALFGRNWGCRSGCDFRHLHFELCYYQAIEAAIEMGLQRVEAGAQGEHKIARGYLPKATYSSHFIRDGRARPLLSRFLSQEAREMEMRIEALRVIASPFKADRGSGKSVEEAIADIMNGGA